MARRETQRQRQQGLPRHHLPASRITPNNMAVAAILAPSAALASAGSTSMLALLSETDDRVKVCLAC